MSQHFALSSELSGAIAKRLPHAKNQLSMTAVSSINSLQRYIYMYIYLHTNTQTNNNRVLIVKIIIIIIINIPDCRSVGWNLKEMR